MNINRNDLLSELITKQDTNSFFNKNIVIFFFILCSACIVFVGGLYSNSFIIMMDSLFILWSLIGLITYILNKKLQKRLPDNQFNFGYFRGECIGGLLSLIFFWIFSFELGVLSIKRLFEIEEVYPTYMINSAIISIFINIINSCLIHFKEKGDCIFDQLESDTGVFLVKNRTLLYLKTNKNEYEETGIRNSITTYNDSFKRKKTSITTEKDNDMTRFIGELSPLSPYMTTIVEAENDGTEYDNDQKENCGNENKNYFFSVSCFIHVLVSTFSNIFTLIIAILLYLKPSFSVLDPLITTLLIIYINSYLIPVVKYIFLLIMEANPIFTYYDKLRNDIEKIKGVIKVKSIHIWMLSKKEIRVNIVVNCKRDVLKEIKHFLKKNYRLHHTNIQTEIMDV